MSRAFYVITLSLMLTACSTIRLDRAMDQVRPGMDKANVLEMAGNPKRTYRAQGQDHWIYIYFKDERELSRIVVFDGGRVAKVTPARSQPNWEAELEGMSTPAQDSGFKPVDGNPE